ncbi:MAG TPA: serine hydrolase domain-containing protein [Vicinamibacterales bacterium]|nr:serine hydrolase domain-containing protein [Vicinamibacterales bacterium]
MHGFAGARQIIQSGIDARAFPAATIEVGRRAGPIWQAAFGRLTYDADATVCEVETIFDLASLTKVISTTSIAMRLVDGARLALDSAVGTFVPAFATGDRGAISIRHLLTHSSGLPAHATLWETVSGRAGFERAIADLPLERAPGTKSVYSDPGFMLLGFALETAATATLDAQFQRLSAELGEIWFNPRAELIDRIAPTEHDPWRARLLRGEVHDENAAALGGVAAHAGLFGTAPAVGAFARLVLRTFHAPGPLGPPELMRLFATRSDVPESSRALGWDTMLPTSSCGTRLSPTAIGHTGFTGTSLWIDWENDLYVVLLTNRVHPTRANEQHVALRPKIHDAVMKAVKG